MTSSPHPTPPLAAEDNDIVSAAQLLNSVVLPMVLNAAVQLDLFEVMARCDQGGGLTADEIAAKLKTSNAEAPAMLDWLLCHLASHDVVRCSAPASGGGRVYRLTPVSKYFVKKWNGSVVWPVGESASA